MSSTVEKIKDRLTIEEVVGSYLKLEKAGANLKGKCPFHNEKTPSFFVSPERNSYYCFGCGAKGDIFSFVQEFERVDFVGALKILAEKAGVEIEKTNPQVKNEKERLFLVLENATHFFEAHLERNEEVKAYLIKRGLKAETIKEWRLGYVAEEWNSLEQALKTRGFTQQEMEKTGLIKKGDKGTYYDRFRGRIMFPLFDPSGRVIGFSGRIVETAAAKSSGESKEAKYLNSPETELFDKSSILYGYHKAKTAIRLKDYSILVEGQMDLLMSHQEGFQNTVATSGTALTTRHLEILKRISPKVMVVYDADQAGVTASLKAWQSALALGMDVKIAQLPQGSDPADMLLKDKEEWKEALKNSKHVIDFCLEALMQRGLDERKRGVEVEKNILPYVRALESNIEQSHFISKISHQTGIKEDALWVELRKIPVEFQKDDTSPPTTASIKPTERLGSVERKVVGILLWQEGKTPPEVDPNDIRSQLERILGQSQTEELVAHYTKEKEELTFETETYYQNASKLSGELKELFLSFEEEYLKQQFSVKMALLAKAERDKNSDTLEGLLKECQDISKRLSALHNHK